MRRIRTTAAAMMAGAAMVVAMAATPAYADEGDGDAGDTAVTDCTQFDDVAAGSVFCDDITWLAASEITHGFTDGGFHPGDAVTRQAAAAFLFRLTNPNRVDPHCGVDIFGDVPQTHGFCGVIGWLAAEHVTQGYADGGFHPTDTVSRQAVAAFLYRITGHGTSSGSTTAADTSCEEAPFDDVAAGSPFCAAIDWMVSHSITQGYGDGGFHPHDAVTRQAMAAFLHRLDSDLNLSAPYTAFGTGTHIVGDDNIPAGTYRVLPGTDQCTWSRLRGFSGGSGDVIANETAPGPSVVTIAETDKGITSTFCGFFTSDLRPLTDSDADPLSDGTWIVGTDMAPGQWRSAGPADSSEQCYWERLGGFTGDSADRLAGGLTQGQAVVTIASTDHGFNTSGCAPWTKVD